jgi:hypothetical protein
MPSLCTEAISSERVCAFEVPWLRKYRYISAIYIYIDGTLRKLPRCWKGCTWKKAATTENLSVSKAVKVRNM